MNLKSGAHENQRFGPESMGEIKAHTLIRPNHKTCYTLGLAKPWSKLFLGFKNIDLA